MRALVLTLALSACATAQPRTPIDPPLTAAPQAAATQELEGDVLALSLSGGGARAAAFSLGALQQLRDMRAPDGRSLLDHVALVTSVSGGSIIAAHYGLHGADGLDAFRAAYLDKDWNGELNSPVMPFNWTSAWRGGLNSDNDLTAWLDDEIFAGATFADFRGPRIVLNAADLYNGVPFAFTPLTFNALCADLSQVRVADAVAASMAVPVFFHALLAEPHDAHCPPQPDWIARAETDRAMPALQRAAARALRSYRDPDALRYIHLVDGGLIDNLGLSALILERQSAAAPFAPLTEREAVRTRRMTFLVINAENVRDADWQNDQNGPNAADTLDTAYDVSVEAANRAAYDAFRVTLAQWEEALRAWRCALPPARATELGASAGWVCGDITIRADMIGFADLPEPDRHRLGVAPTRVSLAAAEIDALIAGGRAAVAVNAAAQDLTR